MQFLWRETPIRGHAAWRSRIGQKNDQPGRSAPTIAEAWSGPAEVYAAFADVPELRDLVIEKVGVEVQTRFDDYEGGKRNHDLVIEGESAGTRTVVCVEAKAGESLGAEIAEQARASRRAHEENEDSKASDRLLDLLRAWANESNPEAESVRGLRYQLFTAAAGTVAEARKREACQAVLFIHDFLTDDRPATDTRRALEEFVVSVFPDTELPEEGNGPWCIEVSLPSTLRGDDGLRFYLARAVTDLSPRNRADVK